MIFNMHFLCFSLIFCLFNIGKCYLPVICIAGFKDSTGNLKSVCNEITKLHPGTHNIFLQPGGALFSIFGMWTQVKVYRKLMNHIFKKYPDGVHILAHSQGALIARAILQTTPNHPVKNLLSIAGPLVGDFGIPPSEEKLLKLFEFGKLFNFSRHNLHKIMYSKIAQKTTSIAGYWNDPTKQKLFLKKCNFLPYVNNLKPHPHYIENRNNFLLLNKMILVGGDGDESIFPWQSEHGGFYDKNLNIIPLKEQNIYKNDTFGLRTLDERGGLTIINISGARHDDFVHDLKYTRDYYIHYLY